MNKLEEYKFKTPNKTNINCENMPLMVFSAFEVWPRSMLRFSEQWAAMNKTSKAEKTG